MIPNKKILLDAKREARRKSEEQNERSIKELTLLGAMQVSSVEFFKQKELSESQSTKHSLALEAGSLTAGPRILTQDGAV